MPATHLQYEHKDDVNCCRTLLGCAGCFMIAKKQMMIPNVIEKCKKKTGVMTLANVTWIIPRGETSSCFVMHSGIVVWSVPITRICISSIQTPYSWWTLGGCKYSLFDPWKDRFGLVQLTPKFPWFPLFKYGESREDLLPMLTANRPKEHQLKAMCRERILQAWNVGLINKLPLPSSLINFLHFQETFYAI